MHKNIVVNFKSSVYEIAFLIFLHTHTSFCFCFFPLVLCYGGRTCGKYVKYVYMDEVNACNKNKTQFT